MKTEHCSGWRRYRTKWGQISVHRSRREVVGFIPTHTPHVVVDVSRQRAAAGLREWRKLKA